MLALLLCCEGGARAAAPTVFIGGVGPHYRLLADPAVVTPLLATGTIGLYQHANGNAALSPAQRAALWAAWGSGATVGEVGAFVPVDAGYRAFFGGRYPDQVDMNVTFGPSRYTAGPGDARPGRVYTGHVSADGLVAIKAAIDAAAAAGGRNVAVFLTPNEGGEDLDDAFAAAPFWAPVREAALYGGGIGLDVPPSYWAARGPAYQAMVAAMVAWANARHIRSSLVVSPYAVRPDAAGNSGACGYDPAFAMNTQHLAAALTLAAAKPSQWVVENYGLPGPGCGTSNDVEPGAPPGSLNAVALFLAQGGTWPAGTAPGR